MGENDVTKRELFTFKFIGENDGKGIPTPLPETVVSLMNKGLVKAGDHLPAEGKIRCHLTDNGMECFKKL